jgi:cyclophilin family peptidyl-prolyl cis-trans isomerase
MKIQRSDGFVVQSGKPENAPKGVDGYIDPATGKERSVPLEIMPESSFMKKKAPEYDFTFEENGMYREQPVLPFNAFGTLAMARREADNNSASSQFFFLLRESELTPSGTNILDGRYSIFGYVVDNQELLRDMKVDDEIVSMKIVRGAENLVKNEREKAPTQEEQAPASE